MASHYLAQRFQNNVTYTVNREVRNRVLVQKSKCYLFLCSLTIHCKIVFCVLYYIERFVLLYGGYEQHFKDYLGKSEILLSASNSLHLAFSTLHLDLLI